MIGKAPVVTEDDINTFYKNIEYTPIPIESAAQRTVKKELNPIIQFVDEKQENLIHCILHLRRIETIHEGLRWYDIKRYGIEISHNREGLSSDILTQNDLRRAFQLPQDVINAVWMLIPETIKNKSMKKIKVFILLALALAAVSCSEEDLDSKSIFDTSSPERNAFETWILDNYTEPYNIDLKYRFEDIESDMKYNVTPAAYDKSVALAQIGEIFVD